MKFVKSAMRLLASSAFFAALRRSLLGDFTGCRALGVLEGGGRVLVAGLDLARIGVVTPSTASSKRLAFTASRPTAIAAA